MNITELYLYNKAARVLTRRKVWLRWQVPVSVDTRGEVSKKDGVFHITIDPRLDPEEKLQVFLHELSHIVLHGSLMVDVDVSNQKPNSRIWGEEEVQQHKDFEEEADKLADRWMSIAEAETTILTPFRKLQALVEWRERKDESMKRRI